MPNNRGQLVLPVEIWLEIPSLLSSNSLNSLAQCCSWLYLLVHTEAPFRTVSFQCGGRAIIKEKCKHPSLLRFAIGVNWESSSSPRRQISDDTLNSDARSFRFMLSSLSQSISLCTLSVTNIDIAEAQQIIVFSLPSLRTLKLHNSHMRPTTKPLPTSRITHLTLSNPIAGPPIFHLLRHVASSLETIELMARHPINVEVLSGFQAGRLHLLNLRLCVYPWQAHDGPLDTSFIWRSVEQHASITSLEVSKTCGILLLRPDPQLLPNLRDLTCDRDIASVIVPGRPVTSYQQLPDFVTVRSNDPALFVTSLAKSQAGIRRARLLINCSFAEYLHIVARQLPLLEMLDIFVPNDWTMSRQDPFYLSSIEETEGFAYSSLFGRWVQSPACDWSLPSLRYLRVYIERPIENHPYCIPRDECREFFKNHFLPKFPGLKVFECRAVSSPAAMVEGEEVPQEWQWKVKRKGNGEWEEQVEPPTTTSAAIP
jgi:hypothetical protein